MEIALVFEEASQGTGGYEQRVAAVDLDRAHWRTDSAPTFDIGIGEVPEPRTIQEVLTASATSPPQLYPGWTLLGARLGQSQTGVPLGIVDVEFPSENMYGEAITFRFRRVWFLVNHRLAVLTVTQPFGNIPELEPVIDGIMSSIELLPSR